MTNPARHERQELCDLLLATGPDAPTLCEGWTTRDLAAHLVVRESRPDAAGGILIKRLAPYGDRVRNTVASRDWDSLVSTVRNGPPKLSPMRIPALDRLTNTLEFFVHLEDVRRAQPEWSPRSLSVDLEATLLNALRRGGRLIARRAPCGLTATPTGHGTFTLRQGSPTVDLAGDIGEIVLYLYGRSAHARVSLTGPDDAVASVTATKFGV